MGHRKHECPAGDKMKSPDKTEGKGKDIKEGKENSSNKGKGKAAGKGKPQLNKTTSAPSTSMTSGTAGGGSGSPQVVETAESSDATTTSSTGASVKPSMNEEGGKSVPNELLGEVTSFLRSLRAPQICHCAIIVS